MIDWVQSGCQWLSGFRSGPAQGDGLPFKEKPLTRGREYVWEVLYETPDGLLKPCVTARFYTANPEEVGQMEKLRPLEEGNDPADLFLAALTYDHLQYYAEALAAYERLCRLRPTKGIYQAARAGLYEQAGRHEEAKKAWSEAEKAGVVRPTAKTLSPEK